MRASSPPTFPAPNWVAADGVSVSGAGGFGSGTCPTTTQGSCRFFGTSAAAPSAAGVAAAVRQEFRGRLPPRALNLALARLAVGSVSRELLDGSTTPVLVVPKARQTSSV